MPRLPAFCDTCLALWFPNAISVENSSDVTISNVTVGPCPQCGGTGHIPDGVYSATTDTIRVLGLPGSGKSAMALERLRVLLEVARERDTTGAELAHQIQSEGAELGAVAALVEKLATSGFDIKYWIGIALAVIAIWQGFQLDAKVTDEDKKIDAIYNQLVIATTPPTSAPARRTPTTRGTYRRDQQKVGRNEPCPCGSGRKYKRCHGRVVVPTP